MHLISITSYFCATHECSFSSVNQTYFKVRLCVRNGYGIGTDYGYGYVVLENFFFRYGYVKEYGFFQIQYYGVRMDFGF